MMERGGLLAGLWIVVSIAAGVSMGEEFKVGDGQGWHEPDAAHADMYALWAGRTNFHVGDSLYFEYTNDSVVVVDKRGYYHCNMTNSTAAFHDGKTLYPLRAAGLLYFISGSAGHCAAGQRLIVDVSPAAAPFQPPSLPPAARAPPLRPPSLPPAAVAPTAARPARPPHASAADGGSNVNALVLLVGFIFL